MSMKRIIGGFFCALLVSVVMGSHLHAAELTQKDLYAGMFSASGVLAASEGEVTSDDNTLSQLKLYATSAVLMDAESGRVLYGKNADVPMAMASTTKIMTCILLLEKGNLEDELQVSSYAASMPKVKLYIKKGETYLVKDLLYSLMLESHNDAAVALAEYIGKQYLPEELKNKNTSEYTVEESKQAVAAFAALMNEKAAELGCENTYFITPNGLDATATVTAENGETIQMDHHTTAEELAKIMAYCILDSGQKDRFLEITRTPSHSFSANGRSFSCVNHNSFLTMMSGALSGKTGFTNKAGYCYVGALEREGRTYTIALLACGWPNHKTWKWADSKVLFTYGLDNYEYREFAPKVELESIPVLEGASPDGNPFHEVAVSIQNEGKVIPIRLLTEASEQVVAHAQIDKVLMAPVEAGTKVGNISYYLIEGDGSEQFLAEEAIFVIDSVKRIDLLYLLNFVVDRFLLG